MSQNDGLPTQICDECLSRVNAAFDFRIQCENADKTLHEIISLVHSPNKTQNKSTEHCAIKSKLNTNWDNWDKVSIRITSLCYRQFSVLVTFNDPSPFLTILIPMLWCHTPTYQL